VAVAEEAGRHRGEGILNNEEFFDSLAGEWDKNTWSSPPASLFERVISGLNVPENGTVLDIGCGTGILFPYYLKSIGVGGRLYALDVSTEMLKEAMRKFPVPNLDLIKADAHSIPLEDNSCDAVVAFSCFPHFENPVSVLREMGRIARLGRPVVVFHSDNRETINNIHRGGPACIRRHILPTGHEMEKLMKEAGLAPTKIMDDDKWYYAEAVKKKKHQRESHHSM
jgi:ubiquinone/menaquinone biosynthesis C-methylase UbiE